MMAHSVRDPDCMPKPGAAINRFGNFALIALAAGFLPAACSESEPVVYAVGEPIPLILFELRVVKTESVPNLHPYARRIYLRDGEKAVAVHVSVSGLDGYEYPGMIVIPFLQAKLYVVDDVGDRYSADDAVSRREYMGHLPTMAESWRNFVIIFIVHEDSRALVLHIEHPEPPDGGSGLLAVPLGT